jgi:peptide/nickel transport system substrate-binding protein
MADRFSGCAAQDLAIRRRWLLAGAAGLAAGCSLLGGRPAGASTGGKLIIASHADLPIPDAHQSRAMVTHMVMKHVVECLVTFDEDYKLIPQLAESWEALDGGARYLFRLRQGVKFHNGADLTAEDVKWSLERLAQVSPSKGDYSAIKTITIRDPHTLEIGLDAPSPILPAVLAGPWGGYIMPKGLDQAQGSNISKPVGTGPFEWVDYQPGRLLSIRKFAGYVPDRRFPGPTGLGGRREATVDAIDFRVVPDSSARATGLETGELDFSLLIELADFERLHKSSRARAIEEPSFESLVLWLGVTQKPTDDPRFRKAVATALDYEQIMQASLAGHGAVNNAFLHPDLKAWMSEPMARRHRFDKEAAKRLLGQTAYRGEALTIHTNSGTEYSMNAALVMQQQLGEVGINIEVRSLDSAGVMAVVYARQPTYHFGMTSISGRMDPDQVYYRRLHSSVAVNGYRNPDYDRAVEAARASTDMAERVRLYGQAQSIVMDDVPAIVLFNVNFFNGARKPVTGYKANALGLPRFWNVASGR